MAVDDDEMAKKLYELSEWMRMRVGFTITGEFIEWGLASEELKNIFRAMAKNDPERWIKAIKSTGEWFEEGSSDPHQPPRGSNPN